MHLNRYGIFRGFLFAAALALLFALPAFADGPNQGPPPVDNSVCLACHSNSNLTFKLSAGETVSMFVDQSHYADSVHGQKKINCVDCHTNISSYPHPALAATSARDLSLQMNALCKSCHTQEFQNSLDSVHAKELAAGNRNAPVCTDCHTAHAVTALDTPRTRITDTCRSCHSAIYDQYKSSAHGAALLSSNSNPDVPTCVDCHGVHNISDPLTAAYRLKSPQLCAKCHTNTAIMSKYNISTNVLNTYVADFHGTTVQLFEKQSPDAATNKPVCFDCHGAHDIKGAKDPASTVFQANLLTTCQRCHPNATVNFPASWLSHYDASPSRNQIIYYVNLFYWILIPLVIGGMLIFVLLDIRRRLKNRRPKEVK
jgi:predicted CXXCH cytochrome family protein